MLIHPSPKPVITITNAPTTSPAEPADTAPTAAQSMRGMVSAMYSTVTAPVIQVSTDCSFIIAW